MEYINKGTVVLCNNVKAMEADTYRVIYFGSDDFLSNFWKQDNSVVVRLPNPLTPEPSDTAVVFPKFDAHVRNALRMAPDYLVFSYDELFIDNAEHSAMILRALHHVLQVGSIVVLDYPTYDGAELLALAGTLKVQFPNHKTKLLFR